MLHANPPLLFFLPLSLSLPPSLLQIVHHILILTTVEHIHRDRMVQCPLQGDHSLAPHPLEDPFHLHPLDMDSMVVPLCPPLNIPLVPGGPMVPHPLEHLDHHPQNFNNQDLPTNH